MYRKRRKSSVILGQMGPEKMVTRTNGLRKDGNQDKWPPDKSEPGQIGPGQIRSWTNVPQDKCAPGQMCSGTNGHQDKCSPDE